MTKELSARIRGHVLDYSLPHTLILLFLWFASGDIRVWLVFLYIYLTIVTIAFVREIFLVWRRHHKRKYARQTTQLLLLLRESIDLAYVYDNDPEKFYRKFLEIISVASLGRRGIIDPDALLHTAKYNRVCESLKREDAELWTLLRAGFTNRELKIIYGHTNINSVYVKCHRLRSRLDKHMQQALDGIDSAK